MKPTRDAMHEDFEPEPYTPRWSDNTPKHEKFWNDHDRGQVAHQNERIEHHRKMKQMTREDAKRHAEREKANGGV